MKAVSDLKVVGDYQNEMSRRIEARKRSRIKSAIGVCISVGLVWFAILPLGLEFWHQVAFLGGIILMIFVSEGATLQLADEVDLLEHRIAIRMQEIDGRIE
jgi:hypothetical protein